MSETTRNDGTLDVQELLNLALRYARGMWRFRWIALGSAWIVCIGAWVLIYLMPDRFQASARVYVDTQNVLRPLLRGLSVETDVLSDVAVMTRVMVSRPNLERVSRELDMDIAAQTPQQYEQLLSSLESRVTVARDRENIYQITFTDHNRKIALGVVDSLLESFVEQSLGSGQEDSAQAERALQKEIEDYERRMAEAEDRVKEFKRKNVGMMPNEYGDYYDQLQRALSELDSARQAVTVSERQRTVIIRQLEGEEPTFGLLSPVFGAAGTGNPQVSSLDAQIHSLEQRRTDLLVEFTEKHPEVVRIDSLLQDLRSRRRDELAAMPPVEEAPRPAASPLDLNPVYQNLKIQLSNIEVLLASQRETLEAWEAKVAELQRMVDVIPQVEAELSRLNRDYNVVRERYQAMLERWEDLQTARRVRSGTDEIQFRIIDPPFASSIPVGPPRVLYLVMSFAFALGVGGGVAFLLNLIKPVFHASRDLADLGFPVLGSVARSESPQDRKRRWREKLYLSGAAACLVASLIAVVVFAESASALIRQIV